MTLNNLVKLKHILRLVSYYKKDLFNITKHFTLGTGTGPPRQRSAKTNVFENDGFHISVDTWRIVLFIYCEYCTYFRYRVRIRVSVRVSIT